MLKESTQVQTTPAHFATVEAAEIAVKAVQLSCPEKISRATSWGSVFEPQKHS